MKVNLVQNYSKLGCGIGSKNNWSRSGNIIMETKRNLIIIILRGEKFSWKR
jgi:hypothetical protein